MLYAESTHAMTVDRAEPGERGWMPVEHGDDAAVRRQAAKQSLDMRAGMNEAGPQSRTAWTFPAEW